MAQPFEPPVDDFNAVRRFANGDLSVPWVGELSPGVHASARIREVKGSATWDRWEAWIEATGYEPEPANAEDMTL